VAEVVEPLAQRYTVSASPHGWYLYSWKIKNGESFRGGKFVATPALTLALSPEERKRPAHFFVYSII
jgi:hypothetical protein